MAHKDLAALVRQSADGYRSAALVVAHERVRDVFERLASERSVLGVELSRLGSFRNGGAAASNLAWSRRLAAYPPRTLPADTLLVEAERIELALSYSYRSALVAELADPTAAAVLERHLAEIARAGGELSHLRAAIETAPSPALGA